MKAYVAGPMTGYPEFNYPAFNAAEDFLTSELGWAVVNPAKLDALTTDELQIPHGAPGGNGEGSHLPDYLRRDFRELVECQALVLLKGWRFSAGANAELAVARWLDMEVYTLDGTTLKATKAMPNYVIVRETWQRFGWPRYEAQVASYGSEEAN